MLNFFKYILLILSFILAIPAMATTENYGTSLTGGYQPSASFASLSVTGSGSVYNFTLSALDLNSIFAPGAFISGIAVNISPNSNLVPSISAISGDSPVSVTKANGPTGQFDFRFDLTGKNQARLTANESVSWTATFANPVTFEGNQFALHVQGEGGGGWYVKTPAEVTTAVPEPKTYSMMLVGLGLIGFMVRRKYS